MLDLLYTSPVVSATNGQPWSTMIHFHNPHYDGIQIQIINKFLFKKNKAIFFIAKESRIIFK